MARNTLIRSLHDIGPGAWFGGTLANAVALNAAAPQPESRERGHVTNVGWDRWTPVNAAAIGAHLVGATILANRDRVAAQQGVGAMTVAKTALSGAALGATRYRRVLGPKMSTHPDGPVHSATEPAAETPPVVAAAQKPLRILAWAVPGLAGTLVVLGALAAKQQRPSEQQQGLRLRLKQIVS